MAYDDPWDSYPPAKILPTTLSVENFGPIAKAEVELRPLTVLVGPSDTGKSYLSALIYALHNLFSTPSPYLSPFSRRESYPRQYLHLDAITPDLTKQVFDLASEWWHADELGWSEPEAYEAFVGWLPEGIVELISSALAQDASFAKTTFSEIARCFGVEDDLSMLVRHGGSHTTHVQLSTRSTWRKSKVIQFEAAASGEMSRSLNKITASIPRSAVIQVTPEMRSSVVGTIDAISETPSAANDILTAFDPKTASEILAQLLPVTLQQLGGPFANQAYYLPADRGGLMHVHLAVVRALIGRDRLSLPGPLLDFLEDLVTIPSDSKHQADDTGQIFAKRLEQDVLKGDLGIARSETGYPMFFHRPVNWTDSLALTRASSKISEIAPLVLFLRYFISPRETLIIDEPESHLHPEAQVAMATFLARLVKAGYRIVIATHSDWILEQLANLVRMSNLTPEERKNLDGADAALTPEQFGAWLFRYDTAAGGTMVEEIDIDPEDGGLVRDYRQVLDATYNTWAEIGNRIADREE